MEPRYDSQTSQFSTKEIDEISLGDLLSAFWRGKWLFLFFVFSFSLFAVFYSLSLPNTYVSSALVKPASSEGSGGLANIASQLGGIATLAGIDVGGGGSNDRTNEAIEIIKSWTFIEEFIVENNIETKVFAVNGWDPESKKLIYDPEVYDVTNDKWVREPVGLNKAEPSSWELYEKFKGFLSIAESGSGGFKSISIEYYSPDIAKEWVDLLIKKINLQIKIQEQINSQKNIDFLKDQIASTSLASMQSVFYDLIEEQTKNLMLAKGSDEFVFKIVNEARVPEVKSGPKRALICIAFAFLGAFIGAIVGTIWGYNKR